MEIIMLVLLAVALIGFIALGVEDDRAGKTVVLDPVDIQIEAAVTWDSTLPTRRSYLPY